MSIHYTWPSPNWFKRSPCFFRYNIRRNKFFLHVVNTFFLVDGKIQNSIIFRPIFFLNLCVYGNGKLYKQVDGVAIGSPLGPILADAFFVDFGKSWLQNWLSEFNPYSYRWYIDDIFVLYTTPEHLEAFRNFLNSRHFIYNWKWKVKQNVLYHFCLP